MCSIATDNKTGYFNLTADGNAIQLDRNAVLMAGSYYFIVTHLHPHPQRVGGVSDSVKLYKWPVVTNFRVWQFPTQLPEWWRLPDDALAQPPPLDGHSQSSYAQTIHARYVFWRVSQHRTGVEIVHLCLESETAWFARNNMYAYKQRYLNNLVTYSRIRQLAAASIRHSQGLRQRTQICLLLQSSRLFPHTPHTTSQFRSYSILLQQNPPNR